MAQNPIFISTIILTAANILSRLIGALYKIPLNRNLPARTLGLYSYAWPVYGLLYSLCSLGLPGALLKLSAERAALKDGRSVLRVFLLCFLGLGLSGFLAAALLYTQAETLSHLFVSEGDTGPLLMAMAPALFFSALCAVLRAFFQSMDRMGIHGASVVLEQSVKAALSVFLTAALLTHSEGTIIRALGFSVTAGSAAAFFFLLGSFLHFVAKYRSLFRNPAAVPSLSFRELLKRLWKLAAPLIFGSLVLPVFSNLELSLFNRLMAALPGMTDEVIQTEYAYFSARAATLTSLPQVLTASLSMSLVPAISRRAARGKDLGLSTAAGEALGLSLLIGCGAAGLFLAVPEGIFRFLYKSEAGAAYLLPLALSMVLSMVRETQNGILHGLGRMDITVRNQSIVSLLKLLFMLFLIPRRGMMGYAIAVVLSSALSCALALLSARQTLGIGAGFFRAFVPFSLAALLSVLMARWVYGLRGGPIHLLLALLAGGTVYLSLASLSPQGRRTLSTFLQKKTTRV